MSEQVPPAPPPRAGRQHSFTCCTRRRRRRERGCRLHQTQRRRRGAGQPQRGGCRVLCVGRACQWMLLLLVTTVMAGGASCGAAVGAAALPTAEPSPLHGDHPAPRRGAVRLTITTRDSQSPAVASRCGSRRCLGSPALSEHCRGRCIDSARPGASTAWDCLSG